MPHRGRRACPARWQRGGSAWRSPGSSGTLLHLSKKRSVLKRVERRYRKGSSPWFSPRRMASRGGASTAADRGGALRRGDRAVPGKVAPASPRLSDTPYALVACDCVADRSKAPILKRLVGIAWFKAGEGVARFDVNQTIDPRNLVTMNYCQFADRCVSPVALSLSSMQL